RIYGFTLSQRKKALGSSSSALAPASAPSSPAAVGLSPVLGRSTSEGSRSSGNAADSSSVSSEESCCTVMRVTLSSPVCFCTIANRSGKVKPGSWQNAVASQLVALCGVTLTKSQRSSLALTPVLLNTVKSRSWPSSVTVLSFNLAQPSFDDA